MFTSISSATPNTTVTSSFTADEACKVDVGASYVVRVNGTAVTTRPINLKANDAIQIDVLAPGSEQHTFVRWTYNDNECFFAVVSGKDTDKPTLNFLTRNNSWYDFPVTAGHVMSMKTSLTSDPTIVAFNGTTSGFQGTELAVLMRPGSNQVFFYREDGAQVYRLDLPSKPLSHAVMWNGNQQRWESNILCADGIIYNYNYSHGVTKSNRTYPNAHCIFSDGASLFVGGDQFLYAMADINNIGRTYTTTEDITYGVSSAGFTQVVTKSGKILQVGPTALTQNYSATKVGQPAVWQGNFAFPIPDEYKVRITKPDGTFVTDLMTGNLLPYSCAADKVKLAVSYADQPTIGVWNKLNASAVPWSFPYNVTSAVPLNGAVFADHYLREFTLTIPSNPPISGVNFNQWFAPQDVDTGSGEFVVTTPAATVPVAAPSNTSLLVNGKANQSTMAGGDKIALMVRSQLGRKSTVARIGNFAFDFKVRGFDTTEKTCTFIDLPNKLIYGQLSYDFTVPAQVSNAPIAISHGNLKLNNKPYNGTAPVSTGDVINITVNMAAGATRFYGVLSIADSQFAYTMNTAGTQIVDTQRYQPYRNLTTVSSVTVADTGIYDFPNYTNGHVSKDGVILTFPTTLTANDVVEITHTQVSNWWLDERRTVLMGPNTNYVVQSISIVSDMPEDIDFGAIHDGIPDFDFTADKPGVISGLGKDYSITIYGTKMQFSVNGGPLTERPMVKNGDSIVVTHNVINLFDDQYVKTTLYDGRTYEFGKITVDPAKGVNWAQNFPFSNSKNVLATQDNGHLLLTTSPTALAVKSASRAPQAPIAKFSTGSVQGGKASVSVWGGSNATAKTPSAKSQWGGSNATAKTPASTSQWGGSNATAKTPSATPSWEKAVPGAKTKTSTLTVLGDRPSYAKTKTSTLTVLDSRPTYLFYDIKESFLQSFGYLVSYLKVSAMWLPMSDAGSIRVQPSYQYQGRVDERRFAGGWNMFGRATYAIGDTYWYHQATLMPGNFPPAFKYDSQEVEFVPLKPILYGYTTWNHEEAIKLEPVFVGLQVTKRYENLPVYDAGKTPRIYQNIPFNDPSAKPFAARNEPMRAQPAAASAEGSTGWHAVDLQWNNIEPVKMGGYGTMVEATAAATDAAGTKFEYTTYQQPEGSFSYVLKRETTLVCEIKKSSMTARAWLMGGG